MTNLKQAVAGGADREPSSALFESVGFLLAMAGSESRQRWVEWLGQWELWPSQYRALIILGERGPLSQQELAAMVAIDPRNLVTLLDALERKQLVERRPHATDRRRNSVHLTGAGRSLLHRLKASGRALEDDWLRGFDNDEREALRGLLLKLMRDSETPRNHQT